MMILLLPFKLLHLIFLFIVHLIKLVVHVVKMIFGEIIKFFVLIYSFSDDIPIFIFAQLAKVTRIFEKKETKSE